jgi:hypothetical protein
MATAHIGKHLPVMREEMLEPDVKEYLAQLALQQPFNIEISCQASQLFHELLVHWPPAGTDEDLAMSLRQRIEELAEPFMSRAREGHLRLSINVGKTPRGPTFQRGAPAVCAVFDAGEGILLYRAFGADQLPANMALTDVEVGMTVLIQPLHTEGDARAVGMGAGAESYGSFTDRQNDRVQQAERPDDGRNAQSLPGLSAHAASEGSSIRG